MEVTIIAIAYVLGYISGHLTRGWLAVRYERTRKPPAPRVDPWP